jgi:hypothetical protein
VLGGLRVGHAVEPAADVFDRAPAHEGPELLTGDAGIRHLAGTEEGAERAPAKQLRRIGGSGSVAGFVGTVGYHADILVESKPLVNPKCRHRTPRCLHFA